MFTIEPFSFSLVLKDMSSNYALVLFAATSVGQLPLLARRGG